MKKLLFLLFLFGLSLAFNFTSENLVQIEETDCFYSLKTLTPDPCQVYPTEKSCLENSKCQWAHSCYGGNFCFSK